MNRFLSLLLCGCLCLALASCGDSLSEDYPYYEMEHSSMAPTVLLLYYPRTLEELEEHAKYIVEGIPVSRSLIGREVTPFRFYSDYEYDIFSRVRITKVYRGDLEAGGEISIGEGCSIYGSDTNTLVSVYYNMPSEIGKKYLFFLNKSAASEDDTYSLCVYETGRYPVSDPEETPIEKSLER